MCVCVCVCVFQRGSDASLVAMDFSGSAGRVISASEAKSVEREEGQSWRVRDIDTYRH